MNNEKDREHIRHLMMAAIDGEIDDRDRKELDRALAEDASLREEWLRVHRVKEVTATMGLQEPPQEVWDEYWTSVYNRFERGIGWILVSIGAMVLLAYGAWKWVEVIWGDTGVPLFLRLAILTVAVGFIILILSVIREKLFTRRHDPYKEVQR